MRNTVTGSFYVPWNLAAVCLCQCQVNNPEKADINWDQCSLGCWITSADSTPDTQYLGCLQKWKKNISKHCFTWESDPSSSRTFSLIYSWPALSMTLAHILTSGSSLWNSSGPRVTPQLHFSPSSPPSLSPLHVSRFGRDTGLHILCSSVSARPAERGEDIWLWWSYSVYKQITASNTSD